MMRCVAAFALLCLVCAAQARAFEPEEIGAVATLPEPGAHWVWVPDRLLQHSKLYDGDTGQVLGMVDSGVSLTPKLPLYSAGRNEIYSVDIGYTRAKRGDRLDFVTIYDATSLVVTGEVLLPTRTAESNASLAHAELLDDDRWLAIFNQFPNVSVSIVDLAERRFVDEITLAGCAGVYPVGERRLATLCGDGTSVAVELDASGRKRELQRSERFFDVVSDPVAMAAARDGARWLFVSFEGFVHELDFSQTVPRAEQPWSLLDAADRADGWRIGGLQHVALQRGTRRLYTVMHQGGAGTHKDPGGEIWVHDVGERERVARFAVPHLLVAFLAQNADLDAESVWYWLLERLLPNPGAHTLTVSQDAEPLLFVRNAELGVVGVLDAATGEHLRNLEEAGLAGPTLAVMR